MKLTEDTKFGLFFISFMLAYGYVSDYLGDVWLQIAWYFLILGFIVWLNLRGEHKRKEMKEMKLVEALRAKERADKAHAKKAQAMMARLTKPLQDK